MHKQARVLLEEFEEVEAVDAEDLAVGERREGQPVGLARLLEREDVRQQRLAAALERSAHEHVGHERVGRDAVAVLALLPPGAFEELERLAVGGRAAVRRKLLVRPLDLQVTVVFLA